MSTAEMQEELAEIAASVRALVEWHGITGSSGLVTEASPDEVLSWIAPPARGPSRRGAAPPSAARPGPERGQPAPGPITSAATPVPPPRAAFTAPPAPATFTAPPAPATFTPPASPATFTAPAAPPPALNLEGIGKPDRPQPIALPLGLDAPAAPIVTTMTGSETPEERHVKLATLADEARACTRCGLHAQRKQAVFARGNPLSELCFVGEGPGADEDAQGLPFVGKAGQLLDKMIAAMGYGRDDVYICNIVKCRPPENRKPEPNEMAACNPFLVAQLGLVKPKVIVALGATAVQGLTGASGGITRMRGTWKLYKGAIPIMPTFHPAYLLRQPDAKREVWNDLKEVMRFLGKSPAEKGAQ
jgi:DNA polymerase